MKVIGWITATAFGGGLAFLASRNGVAFVVIYGTCGLIIVKALWRHGK